MKRFSIIFVVLTLLSCSKEKDEENDEPCSQTDFYYEIESCLNGFMYETGSYWVYQDTSSLQLDSIIVTSRSNKARFLGGTVCGVPEQAEEIMLTYQSSLKGIYTLLLQGGGIILNNQILPVCYLASKIDSIDISGTLYYDVVEISNLNSGGSFKGYYKEPIGFIRKIEYNSPIDTVTYDLIRYQVSLFSNPF